MLQDSDSSGDSDGDDTPLFLGRRGMKGRRPSTEAGPSVDTSASERLNRSISSPARRQALTGMPSSRSMDEGEARKDSLSVREPVVRQGSLIVQGRSSSMGTRGVSPGSQGGSPHGGSHGETSQGGTPQGSRHGSPGPAEFGDFVVLSKGGFACIMWVMYSQVVCITVCACICVCVCVCVCV